MSDIYITWEEYNKKIEELAIKVYEDGCKFNQVICIAKGGLRVGDIFSRLFDVPLAIMSVESYKKAISIKPDFIQGHINLGLVLLERGDLRQGLESIYGVEGVIKFNDKNCKVLNKL